MRENILNLFLRLIPKNIEDKLKLRQIVTNFSWLLGDKVLRMGLNVVVTAAIARYLGTAQFGLLNYAMAFVAILGAISNLGLDQIIIRNIILHPDKKDASLGSGFILRIAGSLLLILISWIVINIIRPEDDLRKLLILLIAAGSLFQAFDVIDLWFQAQLQSKYTVLAKNIAFIVISCFRVFLIVIQAPIALFAAAILFEYFLGAAGLWIVYKKNKNNIFNWNYDLSTAKSLLKDSWPLIFTGVAVMLYMRIDQIMLKEIIGDEAVGIYSAAIRVAEVWYFIPMAFVNSVFPVIVETKKSNEALYYRRLSKLYSTVTWGALGVSLFVSVFADLIVKIIYGDQYYGSGAILSLTIWAGVFVFQGVARSAWLISENLQKYSYYYTFGASIINILLNLYLIPAMGVKGAAIATIISYFCSVIVFPLFIKATRQSSIQLLKSFIWR